MEIEIIDTKVFNRTEHEKNRYISHLERMTYVVCPRGVENFSIRVYEALKYGRVPVIIDTDMVCQKKSTGIEFLSECHINLLMICTVLSCATTSPKQRTILWNDNNWPFRQ